MREILKEMKSGRCCEICASYFEKDTGPFTHEYPVTCWDCWDELPYDERLYHRRAEVSTNGKVQTFTIV